MPIKDFGRHREVLVRNFCPITNGYLKLWDQSLTSLASVHISIALIQRAWAHASISSEPVEALNTLMWPVPKPPMMKSFSKQTDEHGNLTKIKILKDIFHRRSLVFTVCVYSLCLLSSIAHCAHNHIRKWNDHTDGELKITWQSGYYVVIINCLQISICLKWQLCRMRASSPIMSREVSCERTGQWAREGGKYLCLLSGAALTRLLLAPPKGELAHRLMTMLILL